MTAPASPGGPGRARAAESALKAAARLWFLAAVLGHWIFAYYVASLYGGSALRGKLEMWNTVFPRGYTPGDTLGNLAVGVHVFSAVIVIGGGPLLIVPQVRAWAPSLHRWLGRIYVTVACATSLVGLYMVWVRGGTTGDRVQHLGVSLDAVLILVFAAQALRYALARDFGTHRRWTLRLFMAVNAVWFFRVGLMFWIFVNGGPVGFDPKSFTGPFLNFLSFAQTLLPLATLELYLRARDGGGALGRLAMTAGLVVLTGAMSVGTFAATLLLWLPRI